MNRVFGMDEPYMRILPVGRKLNMNSGGLWNYVIFIHRRLMNDLDNESACVLVSDLTTKTLDHVQWTRFKRGKEHDPEPTYKAFCFVLILINTEGHQATVGRLCGSDSIKASSSAFQAEFFAPLLALIVFYLSLVDYEEVECVLLLSLFPFPTQRNTFLFSAIQDI